MSGTDSASEDAGLAAAAVSRLEIRVLGPVEIAWDGRPVDIGGVKARALVARLLIDRNLVVSVDRLVDSLWADHDGRGAEIALRSTISRLRKRLRDAGAPEDLDRDPRAGLRARGAGRGDRRLPVRTAGGGGPAPAGPPAPERVRAARSPRPRSLWRGPAYSEVRDEPFARAEARRLEELLLSATETRIDAGLTLGRHEALVGELEALTECPPAARAAVVAAHAGALPLGPPGRGAAGLPGSARHPGGRAGDRAGARRDLDGARHPRPGPRARLPGPARTRRRSSPTTRRRRRHPPPTRSGCPPPRTRARWSAATRESALLRDWWASVPGGAGRLLLVDGDPGIGKTRLVAELARAVEDDGALVLWGRCDEDPVAPFQPFAEALGRYFQSLSADRISRMPDWQLTELSRLVPRLREYAPIRSRTERRRSRERALPLLRGGDGDAERAVAAAAPSCW